MRQHLLPLLLCLFTSISVFSFDVNHTEELQQLSTNTIEFNGFSNSLITDTGFETGFLNSNYNQQISAIKNSLFNYYSINALGGGISLNKEFSYNIISSSPAGATTLIPPVHVQGNFFGQGMFYGFAFTIILLNLVCFFIFEEKVFAYFSVTVAALITSLFFAEGLLPILGIYNIINEQLMQATLLLVATVFSVLFASKFLSHKEFYPNLIKYSFSILAITALLLISAKVSDNLFLVNISNVLLFGVISIYFITAVLLFSSKNYAKFYVIASFIPLLFAIDFFVLRNFSIDFLFTEAIHLKVAMIFEILILSYAIFYRMQEVTEESELRQTELRIFLKRQDILSRTKVEEIIEDVYLENLIMHYDLDGFEIKLLQYISEGKTNQKIARKLKVSENDIVDATKNLYQKLEISEHIQEDYRLVENQPDYIYN